MHRAARRNSSLTQGAYERLRADLLACRLQPGTRLKITEICQDLSVSLSAVRQALARLTSEGLVVAEPQRGFHAAPISTAELTDLTGVRIRIETACLERAIAAGDIAWKSQLVATSHRLSHPPEREPSDPQRMNEAWSTAHAAFHEALVGARDSPWLLRLRAMLYAQSERYRRLSVPLAEISRDLGQEHRGIMDAVIARDVACATELMTRHLELTTRVLLEQSWALPASVSGREFGAGLQACGTVTPIMSVSRTRAANRTSSQPSVPGGRSGSTIQR